MSDRTMGTGETAVVGQPNGGHDESRSREATVRDEATTVSSSANGSGATGKGTEPRQVQVSKSTVTDIQAEEVMLFNSAAEDIKADRVRLERSGAQRIDGRIVQLDRSGAVRIDSSRVVVQGGTAMGVIAEQARLVRSRVYLCIARKADIDEHTRIFLHIGPTLPCAQPTLTKESAVGLGAGFGAGLGLVLWGLRRFAGR